MADNMNKNPNETKQNETKKNEQMQREQGQSGQFDKNRQPEQGKAGEKSAIGGGQSGQSPTGQQGQQSPTGEQGRARSELDENKKEPTNR